MLRAGSPTLVSMPARSKPSGPDVSSVTVAATVTGTSFPLGGHSDDGVGRQLMAGGVASRLTDTDSVDVPPSLVAVHVSVIPLVSFVIVVASQPDVVRDEGDCGSTTLQVTVTWPTYQLSLPSGP